MSNPHHESLNRILKKLEEASNSNVRIAQNPEIKNTKVALMHLLIANIFQISMGFVDEEIEKLDKSTKPKKRKNALEQYENAPAIEPSNEPWFGDLKED